MVSNPTRSEDARTVESPQPQTAARLGSLLNLTVADLMTRQVVTLETDDNLAVAEDVMKLGRFRHLPVVARGKLVGLVTHRDLLGALADAFGGYDSQEKRWFGKSRVERAIPTRQVMTPHPLTVRPTESVARAAEMLRANKYGCLPVVDDDEQLIGIVTEADFLDLVVRTLGPPPRVSATASD